MPETVTLCIPAWNAEAFLAETLASARAQTWPHLRLVISVDRGADRTAELVRDFARPGADSVIVQARRLGWVGNINAALAHVDTPWAMILPHDDVLAPAYVEACLQALRADARAVAAYSDIETFGEFNAVMRQPSIAGSGLDRVESLLRDHFAAVAFRAVFDVRRARRFSMPTRAIGDFAADTLWMARLACRGNMLRVERPLYRKRFHAASTHGAWKTAGRDELDDMWIVHCAELVRELLRARPALAAERRFWDAVRDRLLRRGKANFIRSGIPDRLREADRPLVEMMRTYGRVRRWRPPYRWMRAARGEDDGSHR
jgi:glycosyltransferase involved in cell wall biosynthesis